MIVRSLARSSLLPAVLLVAGLPALAFGQLDSANEKPGSGPNVEIFHDRGDTFVRAGTNHGIKVGIVLPVLGPAIGNTQERRTVGNATVLEVWETLSRVSLDKAASSVPGAKLARIGPQVAPAPEPLPAAPAPTGPTPPPPPPPPPPTPEELPPLKGHADQGGFGPIRRISVFNDSGVAWTDCEFRLPDNTRYLLTELSAHDRKTVMVRSFSQDGVPLDLPIDTVKVKCNQGVGKFKL